MTQNRKISQDATTRARHARKRRELALLLPLIGVLVVVSPLTDALGIGSTNIFTRYVGIFAIWALLIAAAFTLSRLLKSEIEGP